MPETRRGYRPLGSQDSEKKFSQVSYETKKETENDISKNSKQHEGSIENELIEKAKKLLEQKTPIWIKGGKDQWYKGTVIEIVGSAATVTFFNTKKNKDVEKIIAISELMKLPRVREPGVKKQESSFSVAVEKGESSDQGMVSQNRIIEDAVMNEPEQESIIITKSFLEDARKSEEKQMKNEFSSTITSPESTFSSHQTLDRVVDELKTETDESEKQEKEKNGNKKTWVPSWLRKLGVAALGAFVFNSTETENKVEKVVDTTAENTRTEGSGISPLIENFMADLEQPASGVYSQSPEPLRIDPTLSHIIKEKHKEIPQDYSIAPTADRKALKLVFTEGDTIVVTPEEIQKDKTKYWKLKAETPVQMAGRVLDVIDEVSKQYPQIFGEKKIDSKISPASLQQKESIQNEKEFPSTKAETTIFDLKDLKASRSELDGLIKKATGIVKENIKKARNNPDSVQSKKLIVESLKVYKNFVDKYIKKTDIKKPAKLTEAETTAHKTLKAISDVLKDYPSLQYGDDISKK